MAVKTTLGTRFLQYSFAPHEDIINAFLQTLVGLKSYVNVSNDATALALFNAGDAQAQSELPSFNLGGWSLYEPGEADDLSYHELVTGFLKNLCTLTVVPVYCSTYTAFDADLTSLPVITQTTQKAKAKTGFRLYFTLSKPTHVGVIVPKLPAGPYTVKLSGTDVTGKYASTSGTLTVS